MRKEVDKSENKYLNVEFLLSYLNQNRENYKSNDGIF